MSRCYSVQIRTRSSIDLASAPQSAAAPGRRLPLPKVAVKSIATPIERAPNHRRRRMMQPMDKFSNDPVASYFRHSVSTMELAANDEKLHGAIRTIADLIETIFRSGGKLIQSRHLRKHQILEERVAPQLLDYCRRYRRWELLSLRPSDVGRPDDVHHHIAYLEPGLVLLGVLVDVNPQRRQVPDAVVHAFVVVHGIAEYIGPRLQFRELLSQSLWLGTQMGRQGTG